MYYEKVQKYHHEDRKFIFFGGDNEQLFKGVGIELEFDAPERLESRKQHLETLSEILFTHKSNEHYFIENDASLKNGVELITHPHTIDEMRVFVKNEIPSLLDEVRSKTACQESANTAAVHIHISKNLFGETIEQKIEALSKFWKFLSRYSFAMQRIGRREILQKCAFPGREYTRGECLAKTNFEMRRTEQNFKVNRYQALNLSHKDTIEYRAIQTTLDPLLLEVYLEMIWHLANKTLEISWDDATDFDKWFEGAPKIVLDYISEVREKFHF